MQKRVVITGMGLVSPIGNDRETFWQYISKGISGIKVIDRFKNSDKGYQTHIGGEIADFTFVPYLEPKVAKRFSRFTQFSLVAAAKAMSDSHLKVTDQNAGRIGVILGTGIGGLDAVEDQVMRLADHGVSKVNPLAANASVPHAAAAEVSVYFKLKGMNFTVSTGCSASANAIGVAMQMIRSGAADVILSGGAETPFTDVIFATFDASKQLSRKNATPDKAITPYALGRDGFLLAEGASILVLEELEHAQKRGAYIYGEVIGFGSSGDAYDSYKIQPTGQGMAASMELAIRDADITPYEIDYICSHGSGSQSADLKETNAIKQLFGSRAKAVPVSTIKSVMGMPFGASTGFQMIASCLMLEQQIIIPTMNIDTPDPECDLDYVPNVARPAQLNHIIMNSMGLGGNNASLVVKRYNKQL
jgi:3-oxoacyl-[acyl-carrier-protein] synthase II